MKKLCLLLSLLLINPTFGFCGLQDAYGIAGLDGRNPSFVRRVMAAIAFNASAGAVQQAIGNLSNVVNSVNVTGGPGPGTPYVVTFVQTLGASPQNSFTASSSLTGGTSPSISIVHTTMGAGYVNHAARVALASRILNSPETYAALFAIGVAVNSTIQTDFPAPSYGQSGGVTTAQADNDIQFTVNSIFNDYL